MPFTLVNTPAKEQVPISAEALSVGELAKITSMGELSGHIVLQTHDRLVDLTNPRNTWRATSASKIYVKPLAKGEQMLLTVY